MSAHEKALVLERVEASPGSGRKVMEELGVPKSTYYRWRARQRQGALGDRSSGIRSWNRLTPEEESTVLDVAMEYTDLSSRQLSAWITDNRGFSVSESTVYRILKSEGLVPKTSVDRSTSWSFHWVIWLGCTSNSAANSDSVLSPRTAARATFALKVAEWFRLGRLLISRSCLACLYHAMLRQRFHLSHLSSFPRPLLST